MTKIFVFGAGNIGRRLLTYKPKTDVKILGVLDNDKEKWGKTIEGYDIMAPGIIKDTECDAVMITVSGHVDEIREQLKAYGIGDKKIFSLFYGDGCTMDIRKGDIYFETAEFPVKVPFKKGRPQNYTPTELETSKSRARREKEGFFEKYCKGEGLDIGFGGDLLVENCSVWDIDNGDAQFLKGIDDEEFDFVYSSHCLEHMYDVRIALKNWWRVVKNGGYMIIAIPHRDLYEKKRELPSRFNADHKHMFLIGKEEYPDTLDIIKEIKESITDYDIKYVKACDEGWTINDPLVHSNGEYQIELVIQKKRLEY